MNLKNFDTSLHVADGSWSGRKLHAAPLAPFRLDLLLLCAAAIFGDGEEFYDAGDENIVATIKELIETRVRPAVAQDGGDITFRGFKEGTVYLHMKGACAGCPSSTATLKHGIQNLLRHFIPEVQQVEAV